MTLELTYDPQLSRVRADVYGLDAAATTATLERQQTGGVTWTTVRGAGELAISGGATARPVDDYEFTPDVQNVYRLTAYDGTGAQLSQETATVTPDLAGRPWLKVITRPFLNRPVTVQDFSEVSRPARGGVFDVIGRTFPVAVSDVRGSRQFDLILATETAGEAYDVDMLAASGDPVLLQVPSGANMPAGGYFTVGDVKQARPSRTSLRRLFTFPLTEIAAPAPDVTGVAGTWNTVVNDYATWNDVLADLATWNDVLELVGAPGDVIVS